jgi:hypothetical protein
LRRGHTRRTRRRPPPKSSYRHDPKIKPALSGVQKLRDVHFEVKNYGQTSSRTPSSSSRLCKSLEEQGSLYTTWIRQTVRDDYLQAQSRTILAAHERWRGKVLQNNTQTSSKYCVNYSKLEYIWTRSYGYRQSHRKPCDQTLASRVLEACPRTICRWFAFGSSNRKAKERPFYSKC